MPSSLDSRVCLLQQVTQYGEYLVGEESKPTAELDVDQLLFPWTIPSWQEILLQVGIIEIRKYVLGQAGRTSHYVAITCGSHYFCSQRHYTLAS